MVEECKTFITREKENAFFLYWAINWPHYPLQATNKWRKRYKDLPHPRNKYAAFVSTMDDLIGEVLTCLDDLGLRENTIVIFQSDHGHSVEERTHFGGGNPGPYRGCKACLFEGGIRVPSIISFPRILARKETRDQMVSGLDWYPTIASMTGAKFKHSVDGKDISNVLKDPKAPSPHESLYWQLGRGQNAQWVVRSGDWKLLGNPRDIRNPKSIGADDKLFLANLKTDISESKNLAKSNPKQLESLLKIKEKHWIRVNQ